MTRVSFAGLAREIGFLDAVLYGAARLVGKLSAGHARLLKYYITAQPVPSGEITPARRGRQIEVTEADVVEVLAMPVERPREVLEARLRNGGRCLAARKDGGLAGFQWFTLRDYPEDEVRCLFRIDPTDRCAWDFDIFVFPEWRTQPVFTRLWDKCNEILRGAGVRFTLSRINAYNGASRRAHERIGARVVGWALFLCLGRAQFAAFSAQPWVHVSFNPDRIPVLQVSRMIADVASPACGTNA